MSVFQDNILNKTMITDSKTLNSRLSNKKNYYLLLPRVSLLKTVADIQAKEILFQADFAHLYDPYSATLDLGLLF